MPYSQAFWTNDLTSIIGSREGWGVPETIKRARMSSLKLSRDDSFMNEPVACMNDQWLPTSQVGISLFDAGFVFGATLIETQRTFGQELRFLFHHLERFQRNASQCSFGTLPDKQHLTETIEELIEQNRSFLGKSDELSVYLFATPGRLDIPDGHPMWGVYSQKFSFERYRKFFEQGVDLLSPDVSPIPASAIDPHIKHRSRFHWWLAEQQVKRDAPAGTAPLPLLIDEAGIVYDTPIANFGIARNGMVIFPKAETVLDGIGLKITKEILIGEQIKFIEDDIHLSTMLDEADEAFITGSGIGVCPVKSVVGEEMPKNPGPITRRLQEQWNKLVGIDIAGQFRTS